MRARAAIALGLWAAVLLARPGRARALEPEFQVKAEFMERFTRFIDWPAKAFARATDPFVLCLSGKHPFGDYLDKMAKSRQLKKRRLALRVVGAPEQIAGCHLLFVAASESNRVAALVAAASGKAVLTVGDSAKFGEQGLIINFYLDGGNVRFELNLGAAGKSGLKLSSKLIRLGKLVGGKP